MEREEPLYQGPIGSVHTSGGDVFMTGAWAIFDESEREEVTTRQGYVYPGPTYYKFRIEFRTRAVSPMSEISEKEEAVEVDLWFDDDMSPDKKVTTNVFITALGFDQRIPGDIADTESSPLPDRKNIYVRAQAVGPLLVRKPITEIGT